MYDSTLAPEDMEQFPDSLFTRAALLSGQPPYAVIEDGLYCCLNDFLDDIVMGGSWSKEKQIASFDGYTSNLDGTCGAKTHCFMMDKLEEE